MQQIVKFRNDLNSLMAFAIERRKVCEQFYGENLSPIEIKEKSFNEDLENFLSFINKDPKANKQKAISFFKKNHTEELFRESLDSLGNKNEDGENLNPFDQELKQRFIEIINKYEDQIKPMVINDCRIL